MGLLETFASDGADPTDVTDDPQVSVRLLSLRSGEELCRIFHLLLEQLHGAERLPAQGTRHRLYVARELLVICPHFHAGDMDVIAATEPGARRGRHRAEEDFPHKFVVFERCVLFC